jgi:hypothetical protein
MTTLLQVELGGEQKVLRFNFRVLKIIGEITGKDSLGFGQGITEDQGRLFDMVKTIVHAALLAQYRSEKKNVDFTAEDVDDWVGELEIAEAMEIMGHYSKAYSRESDDPNESRVKALVTPVLTKN